MEPSQLVMQVAELTIAAEEHAGVIEENKRLYNEVLDLKGNIRVFCRLRPAGATGDVSQRTQAALACSMQAPCAGSVEMLRNVCTWHQGCQHAACMLVPMEMPPGVHVRHVQRQHVMCAHGTYAQDTGLLLARDGYNSRGGEEPGKRTQTCHLLLHAIALSAELHQTCCGTLEAYVLSLATVLSQRALEPILGCS